MVIRIYYISSKGETLHFIYVHEKCVKFSEVSRGYTGKSRRKLLRREYYHHYTYSIITSGGGGGGAGDFKSIDIFFPLIRWGRRGIKWNGDGHRMSEARVSITWFDVD